MSLGASAYTVASHATIVAAIALAYARVRVLRFDGERRTRFLDSDVLPWTVFAVVSALVVERLFYIVARLLAPRGVDLWEAHPAPDALSILITVSIWSVSLARSHALLGPARAARRGGLEALGLAGLWMLIVATLR